MKSTTILSRQFYTLLLFMAVFSLHGQQNPILDRFEAAENNGAIYLNWVITSGSTCNGIDIFRSVDSLNFSLIGSIGGICGSPEFAQPYRFTDETPVKNSINYYRLELGGSGYSEIIAIELIVFDGNDYQIRPNPAPTQAKIVFENDQNQPAFLKLYDFRGNLIEDLTTEENFFIVNTSHLPGGMYLFTISDLENQSKIKGKLMVQH